MLSWNWISPSLWIMLWSVDPRFTLQAPLAFAQKVGVNLLNKDGGVTQSESQLASFIVKNTDTAVFCWIGRKTIHPIKYPTKNSCTGTLDKTESHLELLAVFVNAHFLCK